MRLLFPQGHEKSRGKTWLGPCAGDNPIFPQAIDWPRWRRSDRLAIEAPV